MSYNKLKIGKVLQLTEPATIYSTYSIAFSERGRTLIESKIDESLGRIEIQTELNASSYTKDYEISYELKEEISTVIYDNSYELTTIEIIKMETLI